MLRISWSPTLCQVLISFLTLLHEDEQLLCTLSQLCTPIHNTTSRLEPNTKTCLIHPGEPESHSPWALPGLSSPNLSCWQSRVRSQNDPWPTNHVSKHEVHLCASLMTTLEKQSWKSTTSCPLSSKVQREPLSVPEELDWGSSCEGYSLPF